MKFTEIDDFSTNENKEIDENTDKNLGITDDELEKMLDLNDMKIKKEDDKYTLEDGSFDMGSFLEDFTEEDNADDEIRGPLERDYVKEMNQAKELEEKKKPKVIEIDDEER